jgi:hypothetical protein
MTIRNKQEFLIQDRNIKTKVSNYGKTGSPCTREEIPSPYLLLLRRKR